MCNPGPTWLGTTIPPCPTLEAVCVEATKKSSAAVDSDGSGGVTKFWLEAERKLENDEDIVEELEESCKCLRLINVFESHAVAHSLKL